MATDGIVSRLNNVAYPAGDERLLDSVSHGPGPLSAPFSARSGRRVNGAGLVVSVSGSPEAWSVTPGAGVIFDSANAGAGVWRFAITTAKGGTMPARPGAGTSRIDYVIARIYDFDALGTGPRELKIEHVPGTAGSTPAPPDLTSRPLSMILATLTVPATGTVSVSQSAARTVAAGGVLPVATTAEMDKLKDDGIAYAGLAVYNLQTKTLHVYDGTKFPVNAGWVEPAFASGWGHDSSTRKTVFQIKNGMCTVVIFALKGSYDVNAVVCNLPTIARPDPFTPFPFSCQFGGVVRPMEIRANGDIVTLLAGSTGLNGTVTFPVA